MAADDDDFDLELDEETLRQIEEEARRKVEAEMLDENILRDIQAEALAEEGMDDVEIDAEMMREIEEEARRLLAEEGFELDGEPMEKAPEPPAEPAKPAGPKVAAAVRQASPPEAAAMPPKPKTKSKSKPKPIDEGDEAEEVDDTAAIVAAAAKDSTARRNAVSRARQRAEAKAREKTRSKVKESASVKLKQSHGHRRAISDISAPPEPASGKKMVLAVVAGFVVIVGIAIGVGQMTKNPTTEPQPVATPSEGGAPAAAPGLTAEEQVRTEWDAMQKELKEVIRGGQTAANLEKAIGMLEAFKTKHPNYADLCDKDIKRYQGTLNFIKGAGS